MIKIISMVLLSAMALISMYPVRFKKKQVLYLMLLPAVSIPTYLVFEASRISPGPHDRALMLACLLITLIMTATRWLLVWYIRWQRTKSYGDTPVIRERQIQVACTLVSLLAATFVATRLW